MDNEKFEKVIDYFKSNSINLPTDVKNSIEDVFNENDEIENVQFYYKSELQDFQNDLRLNNIIKAYIDGFNTGIVHNTWTYYGQMDFSLSEYVALYSRSKNEDGTETDELIEEITNIENKDVSRIYSDKEYAIILYETISWETPTEAPKRTLQLFIYCPEEYTEEEVK